MAVICFNSRTIHITIWNLIFVLRGLYAVVCFRFYKGYKLNFILYNLPHALFFYKTDTKITIQSKKKKILYLVQNYDLQSSLNRGVNDAIFIR